MDHHHFTYFVEKNGKQNNQTRVFLCFFFQIFDIEKLEIFSMTKKISWIYH